MVSVGKGSSVDLSGMFSEDAFPEREPALIAWTSAWSVRFVTPPVNFWTSPVVTLTRGVLLSRK